MEDIVFETERLFLRPPRPEDAEAIFNSYARDIEVTKYLMQRPHSRLEQTAEFIGDCLLRMAKGIGRPFVILLKDNHELIGMLDFRIDGFKADFGYVLARKYWSQGFMTEAMRPVLDWILQIPSIKRVWATHDVDNQASGKVMRKLGMTFEGVLRKYALHPNMSDEPRDCALYAILN